MISLRRIVLACAVMLLLLSACTQTRYTRYQAGFIGTFDTFIQVIVYAESQQEFSRHYTFAREMFEHYHALFDIYNDHEGINNLKTINDNAGVAPVVVDRAIIELLSFSKQAYEYTDGALNIALGPVLSIWHEYRMHGLRNPENAAIPSYTALLVAVKLTDIVDIIIDEQENTVFLTKYGMSLDVGAVGKGFAAERVVAALREQGVTSAVVEAGGDVLAIGGSMAGGGRPWNVGVRHPRTGGIIDSVNILDKAAVTSGDNNRFYIVDDVAYSHIIDPATLMPPTNFASVTIIHESMLTAQMLSTALFIMPLEQGFELAEQFQAAVMWVLPDGSVEFNELYRAVSTEFGG